MYSAFTMPRRASASSSISSVMLPQYVVCSETSCGPVKNPNGYVPPPMPTTRQVAERASHLHAELDRGLDADEVEDDVGAHAAGGVADLGGGVRARRHGDVGAAGAGELERLRALVDGDHLLAVIAFSSCTPMWPRPPTPMATAVDPGTSFGSERRMAWYGVRPASVSGAAATGSRSPSGTTRRAAGTSR